MTLTFPRGKRFVTMPAPVSESAEHALPSLVSRAANFARSVARQTKNRIQGNPRTVSDATRDARRALCKSNQCGFYRASDGRCGKCGCPVSQRGVIESKTELFAEFCPAVPPLWMAGEMGIKSTR